jgi:hypothetical protein
VANPVETVLEKLDRVRRNGAGWQARCPAHDDRAPSLSIGEGEDGRVLLTCHAGCDLDAILATLELTSADLFPPRERSNGQRRIVATFDYTDENGALLYQVVRYDPKGFSQRRPDGRDGWVWNLDAVRRVPFHLPQLLAAVHAGVDVYVVEGEKDVIAAERAGAAATCNPGGAGKWRPGYAEHFSGADLVIVVADSDEPGRAHARTVAASLRGVARTVLVVEPATGKDLADHLAAGHSLDELTEISDVRPSRELDEFLDEDEPEHDWIAPGLLERGDRVILTAREGDGKSTLLRQIAVQFASGLHPFTLADIAPVRVLLIDCENSRRHIRRKLRPLRDEAGDRYQPGNLRVTVAPAGLDLLRADDQARLRAIVTDAAPDVVLLGPVYKLAGGDPTREEVARVVAAELDALRDEHHVALLIEAHTPYTNSGGRRETRPYGASLWSRWPEFGLFLDRSGKLENWRGPRDEREWPTRLRRAEPWPWAATDDTTKDAEWRPTALMARASARLAALNAAGEYPTRNALAQETSGKRAYVFTAIGHLVDDGYADLDDTGKRLIHVRLYVEETTP